MKFVACVDGSVESHSCLPVAAHMAGDEGRVILYSCYSKKLFGEEGQREAHQKVIDASLEEITKHMKGPVESVVEEVKDARSGIVNFVREHQAETVVMSSRGLGTLRSWLGSVSSHVLHHVPQGTAVVISRDLPVKESYHYLVCTDGSSHADVAVHHIGKVLKPTDKVTVLAIFEQPPRHYVMPVGHGAVTLPNSAFEEQVKERTEMAHQISSTAKNVILEESKGAVPESQINVATGGAADVREAILEAANDVQADCIVVGSRGRGEVEGVLLGSVSQHLTHHIEKRALMVVH